MKDQIKQLVQKIKKNREAEWKIDIDGKTYVKKFQIKERLIIFGGGNIGQAICKYAATLGFYVIVVDDRPSFANYNLHVDADEIYCEKFSIAIEKLDIKYGDYVIIATRGHQFDLTCLRQILQGTMPVYLGMMGSKRRVKGVYDLLVEEGYDEELVKQIHMPIGLSIGAATPAEIGISIVAQLIDVRRNKNLILTDETWLNDEDVDEKFLDFLERDINSKAILIVYETSGSTPAKSGAIMAINEGMQTAGTIGGGCAEGIALRKACRLIGTGKTETITLDMTNEVAAQVGMACGGTMKVWMADISQ